jgi:hypothetical protein
MSIEIIILSYEDIIEVQQKRDIKEAEATAARNRRSSNRRKALSHVLGKRSKSHKREEVYKISEIFQEQG